MIFSFFISVLLLLQIPLSLQAPTALSPPPPPSRVKGVKQKAPRIPLPANVDLEKISLRALVDMKPREASTGDGPRYQDYFAMHPKVKSINLHDPNTAKTAKELLHLSADGSFWHGSKNKLTASIKNLIDGTRFESGQHREELSSALKGVKYRDTKRRSQATYKAKMGKEESARLTRLAKKKRKEIYGENYGASRKRRQMDPVLDRPLSYHLDKEGVKLTARQAELKVRELGGYYTSESLLTRELNKYLKERNVSPEERAAVVGIRQHHFAALAEAKLKAERAGKSPWQEAHRSASTIGSPQSSHSSQTTIVDLAPHSQQHHSVSVDPNYESDWKLLEDFLKD